MSTSPASEADLSSSPPRFRASHSFMLDHISAKCRDKTIITSDVFFSRDDTKLVTFQIIIMFGKPDGWISIFRRNVSHEVSIIRTMFSCHDHEKKRLVRKAKNHVAPLEKSAKETEFGFLKFLKIESLGPTCDRLGFVCEIDYESPRDEVSDSKENDAESASKNRLQKDMLELLRSGDQADVFFSFGKKIVKAHKAVLFSRCSYFKTMFSSGMSESVSNKVRVRDTTPEDFTKFLQFIYSGTLPNYDTTDLTALIALADKYAMDELKTLCEQAFAGQLNAKNVVDALLLADRHNCPFLKESAIKVFKARAELLEQNGHWQKLKTSPDLLLQLLSHAYRHQ